MINGGRLTSMTSNVEDGVELTGFALEAFELLRVLPQAAFLLEEFLAFLVTFEHLDGALVERSFSSRRRCDGDVAFTGQLVVGVSEFRKEPSCRLVDGRDGCLGGQDDEDFWCHGVSSVRDCIDCF